jgi:hypothetical protein
LDQVRRLARVLLAARDELERTPDAPGTAVRLRRVRALIAAAELGRTLIEWLVDGKLLPGWVQSGLDRQLDEP